MKPYFSWLPLSILNPSEFSDHHFLYHVALIPFTIIIVLAVIYIISVWLVAGKLDVRPLNYVLEGVTFGLLINPYFPDNIVFGMRHLLPKLVGATDENFAAEYVFTDLAHERLIDQAGKGPGMIEVFRDEEAIIYRVQFHAEGLN